MVTMALRGGIREGLTEEVTLDLRFGQVEFHDLDKCVRSMGRWRFFKAEGINYTCKGAAI